MPYLTFANLIRHKVPLSAADAATLTLAVARVLDGRRAEGSGVQVPPDERILLSNTGDVTFGGVEPATQQEEITALAALLRRLLQLDRPGVRDRRGRVPGGLLVLLARALGHIDLPAPTPDEFRTALIRFAGAQATGATGAAVVFWRAAGVRPGINQTRTTLPLLPATAPRVERRRGGASLSEMRRALREMEREAFERGTAVQPQVRDTPRRTRAQRAAVAASLAAALLLALAGAHRPGPTLPGLDGSAVTWSAATVSADPPLRAIERPHVFEAMSSPRSVPIVTRAQIGRDVFSPSFGPHGQTIYFHAGRAAAPLMRASMTDHGIESITKLLDDGSANYHVTVAPTGRMIAFDSDRDGVRGVYVADAEGHSPRRISGSGYASVPSWSPDGRHLAFVKAEARRRRVWNVWIADVNAGTLRRVTAHQVGQPWGASWFPDGRRLAYSHEQRLIITDLVHGRSTVIASPRPGRLVRTPAVSPDGSRVVFQVFGDGAWVLDVARMRLRRVLPDPAAEEFVWAPNGRTVAYHTRSSEGWSVWKMDI